MPTPDPLPLPIQPVNKPILCSPYEEPTAHWVYDTRTGEASRMMGRRPASYWYKTQRTGSVQQQLFAEEERDDVRRWRQGNYEGATPVTKQLLAYWTRSDRARRLFFCQREAVETVIYLTEILASGKRPRWSPKLSVEDYSRLCRGDSPSFVTETRLNVFPSLIDMPNQPGLPPLRRYGCKMATGSGKTVVMAMLIAWAFCNRGRIPGDERFPSAALVVCPNLTIKERLQVLRPDHDDNYFLVRLVNGVTVLLEIKGYLDDQDRAKHQAAQRWVSAVNNWGRLGRWAVHICRDPQMLGRELEAISLSR